MSQLSQFFSHTHPQQRLRAAFAAIAQGRGVLLLDDASREDEADLIFAAELIDQAAMAQLIRDCSGIVCLCLDADLIERLQLPPMVMDNRSRYGTPFTVAIEAAEGVTTGVSAADRLATVRAALSGNPGNIVSPGHMYPLRAAPGGVLARQGHTEGAIELCLGAGLRPAAVLCELMNPDGSMAKGAQIYRYAEQHALPLLAVADLVAWRQGEVMVKEEACLV